MARKSFSRRAAPPLKNFKSSFLLEQARAVIILVGKAKRSRSDCPQE
ncbi:hypothetical protein VCRA2126O85_610002 [Vibrio crassostreae]|nr:hypothetical protein VCRA2126O85_610002 [Vibrio crassostreae]CAK3056469.1 hypothetical protein VCRA2128O100_650004 [Vibrio crassostreae]CAK3517917.1 hypothetical protein VCRA2128O101_590003 [Vibrio crassostreae]CAK3575719.1 hypothetical protein VCRA2128O105_610002 [Vibrio crassostreae]CAK3979934.1 hypothetical protein VCRA2128O95_650002 [Vibrio crassostreae]